MLLNGSKRRTSNTERRTGTVLIRRSVLGVRRSTFPLKGALMHRALALKRPLLLTRYRLGRDDKTQPETRVEFAAVVRTTAR